jgi:hypothetical protein
MFHSMGVPGLLLEHSQDDALGDGLFVGYAALAQVRDDAASVVSRDIGI